MSNFTKQAIAEAFLKLLDERPLSQITVKDVTQACQVNRQTFYYHFQDIYALMFWIMERDIREFLTEQDLDRANLKSNVVALFKYFKSNERMIRHGYDPVNRVQYETLFRERVQPLMTKYILSVPESEGVSREDVDFIASFYTGSFSDLLIRWIEAGMPDEHRVQLKKYFILMDGGMDTLLKKFAQS